ncbi:uncharacterized protein LOC128240539 isoform X2 [Mya arenaria]|uniref:uncharacterized protein LOC128240539 isoform X2 n=1 Tax=Mya arenaria TaxID=6604 RepID=UPI0022E3029D|nr:uncharacterized protein LOC128240539 isoform X2 [Mya arenaria]
MLMKIALLLLLPLTLASVLPEGNHKEKGKKRFKALTFNTVLLNKDIQENDVSSGDPPNIVPRNKAENVNKVERRGKIVQQLLQSGADLICLQEVIYEEDVQALVDTLRVVYPHSFSSIHSFKDDTIFINDIFRGPICDPTVLNTLFDCFNQNCPSALESGEVDAGLFKCGLEFCAPHFLSLVATSGQDCLICLRDTAIGLRNTCSDPASGGLKRINTHGLLLLSKKPLTNRATIPFYPGTTNNIDSAVLETLYDGRTKVVCSHLTVHTNLSAEIDVAQLGLGDYAAMNTFEVNNLVSRYVSDKRTIILGDFNIGPADPVNSIAANGEGNYNILNGAFTTNRVYQCTFCGFPDNIYNQAMFETDSLMIDHVFASKGMKVLNAQRMFAPVDASTRTSDADGNRPLSDHYGVMADICFK